MADKIKIKASFHSGKGYARHNNHYPVKRDKGNIDYEQTANNRVWTRIKDVTDVVAAEKMVYDEFFTKELEMQNAKYRKKGNYKNIRTMDEWLKSERHRPVEDILQIGNRECYIAPEDLWRCYVEFTRWRKEKYGDHIILISAVMHVDESTPHIHERYVWYYTDENGVKHTGMKKSMEQAGIALPEPDKPEGRYNYRKMTFDADCREKWLDIVEKKLQNYRDVELDRNVDLERKVNRIGHMGVDCWRSYEATLNRTIRTVNQFTLKLDWLKMKEAEIREEQEKLADEAARLKTASQQQDADNAAIAAKMDEIRKREKELAEQERTFKQRVDDAVKRREKAKEKRSRLWSKAYGEDAYNPYDQ
jgi:hypothetical protein